MLANSVFFFVFGLIFGICALSHFSKDLTVKKKADEQMHYVCDVFRSFRAKLDCLIVVGVIGLVVVWVYVCIVRQLFPSDDSSGVFAENYWAIVCSGGYVCVKIVPSLVRLFSPDSASILFDKKSVAKEDK